MTCLRESSDCVGFTSPTLTLDRKRLENGRRSDTLTPCRKELTSDLSLEPCSVCPLTTATPAAIQTRLVEVIFYEVKNICIDDLVYVYAMELWILRAFEKYKLNP
ncbi:hypothetical protein Tco_1472003 [Tanacetum coccineum]